MIFQKLSFKDESLLWNWVFQKMIFRKVSFNQNSAFQKTLKNTKFLSRKLNGKNTLDSHRVSGCFESPSKVWLSKSSFLSKILSILDPCVQKLIFHKTDLKKWFFWNWFSEKLSRQKLIFWAKWLIGNWFLEQMILRKLSWW